MITKIIDTFFRAHKSLIRRILNIVRYLKLNYQRFILRNRTKIFVIGPNKSGTTSLKISLEQLGFVVGNQREAEIIYDNYYFDGDYKPIIEYCKYYQAFQDVPFSCPKTFQHLDEAFPGSKFILTVRDSPEQWYRSVVNHHKQHWGNGSIPSYDQLNETLYIRIGYPTNSLKLYQTPKDDPFNKDLLISHYKDHINDVRKYFKIRESDFIEINVSKKEDYKKFIDFLGVQSDADNFYWENRS